MPGAAGVFGEVMGVVAATLGVFTLGDLPWPQPKRGASIICLILGFVCIVGLNDVRDSGAGAVALLSAAGLFLVWASAAALRHTPRSPRAWSAG